MSQFLTLPINDLYITAGYKSSLYYNYWKFHHYGTDCISQSGHRTVFSPGNGKVLACGADGATDKDRLGNVLILQFDDVHCADGKVRDLICRMYHLDKINVKAGAVVSQGDAIALYGNTGRHTTGAHLHIEFDTDTKFPFHAYGIGGAGNIIKAGTLDTSVDTDAVWYIGEKQTLTASKSGWVSIAQSEAPLFPSDIPPINWEEKYKQLSSQVTIFAEKLQALVGEI